MIRRAPIHRVPVRPAPARLAVCLALFSILSPGRLAAGESPVVGERFQAAIDRSREILAPRLEVHPGLSAAVAVEGRIVWSEGLGLADREAGRRASPETRFRLYSVAKAMTGTLAVRLAEQGRLDLDAPIETYLPDLPERVQPVTLRQLLGHLGGVRHYRKGEWMKVSRRRCETAREALSSFAGDRLKSRPGEEFAYTSFGFVLASAVVEAAAGKPFFEVLHEEILGPSGMAATGPDTPAEYDGDTAAFYWEKRDGTVGVADSIDNSCKAGAGGLLSTSADLARFGMALLAGSLVGEGGIELLSTPQADGEGESTGYSLGWGVSEDRSRLSHSGGSPGGRSFLLLDLEDGIVVALMSNYEGERLHEEAAQIHAAFRSSDRDVERNQR